MPEEWYLANGGGQIVTKRTAWDDGIIGRSRLAPFKLIISQIVSGYDSVIGKSGIAPCHLERLLKALKVFKELELKRFFFLVPKSDAKKYQKKQPGMMSGNRSRTDGHP